MRRITYIIILGVIIALFSVSLSFAAPIIDRVEVTSISDNAMIVTFRTTNETTSAEVFVGIAEVPTTATWNTTEASNYHYAELTGLFPNMEYKFQIRAHSTLGAVATTEVYYFTTMSKPTGDFLFSFAILADIQYAEGNADSTGPRGRPYSQCATTLASAVTEINTHNPGFTVLLGDINEASYPAAADQVESAVKPKLDNLTTAADISYKYFPLPYQKKEDKEG